MSGSTSLVIKETKKARFDDIYLVGLKEAILKELDQGLKVVVQNLVVVGLEQCNRKSQQRLNTLNEQGVVDPKHQIQRELICKQRHEPLRCIHGRPDSLVEKMLMYQGYRLLHQLLKLVQSKLKRVHVRRKVSAHVVRTHHLNQHTERLLIWHLL